MEVNKFYNISLRNIIFFQNTDKHPYSDLTVYFTNKGFDWKSQLTGTDVMGEDLPQTRI